MANAVIRIAVKNSAWHTANASTVIEKGRYIGLEGSNPLQVKLGDGINTLATLKFFNEDLVQEIADRMAADAILQANIDAHLADHNNPHLTSLDQARTVDNFFTGEVDMNSNRLRNIPTAVNDDEAINLGQVNALIDTTIKVLEGYNPTITSLYPSTYNALPIKKGASFKITNNGNVNGIPVKVGDFLISQTDNPGQTDANWMIGQTNVDQANESAQGIAKIASQAEVENEFTSNNTDIVTPQKFWFGVLRFLGLNWVWTGIQSFANGLKTSYFFNDTGEFKFGKTIPGTVLLWTNGYRMRFSATVGGAPSMEIDNTTGKIKLLDETANKLVKTDSNKGLTALSVSEDSIIKDSFDIHFDGQGGVLSVGAKAIKGALPVAGQVTGFSLEGDVSGNVEIDMKKNGVSMIGGGNKIDLIGQSSDTGLPTGWTSDTWAIDDKMEWTLTSATTIKEVWLTVKFNKTS